MPENKTSGGYICKRSGILLNSPCGGAYCCRCGWNPVIHKQRLAALCGMRRGATARMGGSPVSKPRYNSETLDGFLTYLRDARQVYRMAVQDELEANDEPRTCCTVWSLEAAPIMSLRSCPSLCGWSGKSGVKPRTRSSAFSPS